MPQNAHTMMPSQVFSGMTLLCAVVTLQPHQTISESSCSFPLQVFSDHSSSLQFVTSTSATGFSDRHLLWYAVSGEDDRAQGASTLARNPHIQPWSQLEGTTLSAHCAIDVPYSATAAAAPLCNMVVQDVLFMLPCHYCNQHLTKVDSRQGGASSLV